MNHHGRSPAATGMCLEMLHRATVSRSCRAVRSVLCCRLQCSLHFVLLSELMEVAGERLLEGRDDLEYSYLLGSCQVPRRF